MGGLTFMCPHERPQHQWIGYLVFSLETHGNPCFFFGPPISCNLNEALARRSPAGLLARRAGVHEVEFQQRYEALVDFEDISRSRNSN